MYGITETTVHVTYRPVSAADVRAKGSMIGEPIPDLGLYLVDDLGRPVPLGTPGEIAVTGGGVALGYLNRPEENAKRFVELDLGHGTTRAYRSGDLARRLPDGEVEYLGREDAQVKIQATASRPATSSPPWPRTRRSTPRSSSPSPAAPAARPWPAITCPWAANGSTAHSCAPTSPTACRATWCPASWWRWNAGP